MSEFARAEVLRQITLGRPLSDILDSICVLVETQMEGCLCSIHVLNENGTVRLEAAPSLPEELRLSISDPDTRQSCRPIEIYATGTNLELTSDVESHPEWAALYRERSSAASVKSCWSVPVLDRSGKSVGAIFGLYREKAVLSEESVAAVVSVSYLCAIAIERERRDAALMASNERFALLDLISPTGKFQASWSGASMTVNARWRELTGMTEEQAKGEGWLEAVDAGDRERVRDAWRKAVESRSGFVAECRLTRPDRPPICVLMQTTAAGERGYFGTILDITAQRIAEAALRESEERFRLLANNISQLAWMADETGWIVWYNERWYDYTGTSFEVMAGLGLAQSPPSGSRRSGCQRRSARLGHR